jgi:hypothetical protein
MTTIGERLRAHSLAQDIQSPPGVLEVHLQQFEMHFGVALPDDMRNYFLHMNGMGGLLNIENNLFWDNDLFRFWPLQEVARASDAYENLSIEDRSSFFIFADHSICLPAYAVRLTASGTDCHQVLAIQSEQKGGYSTSVVARSFSEFVDRYLTDETSRDKLSLGMPITTEEELDQTDGRAATLKWLVENSDEFLSILTSFANLPGEDTFVKQLGTLRRIKKKAVEDLNAPGPHSEPER